MFNLKMEVVDSCETTRHRIPEQSTLFREENKTGIVLLAETTPNDGPCLS
jgi:hypothetical protein